VTKFTASYFTGSSAMLSEGIHSVVDTGNDMLMLFGGRASKKPPDEEHPFGHGRKFFSGRRRSVRSASSKVLTGDLV
jgi:divalent metal cation (Fe/Co/Zn/Cd) transporter